jgi:hypothetical protein
MHYKGNGVPQNYSEAMKWYKKAADQGYTEAQYNLGVMYYFGKGVPQNYAKAYSYWSVAAALNDQSSKKNLLILKPKMTSTQIAKGQALAEQMLSKTKAGSSMRSGVIPKEVIVFVQRRLVRLGYNPGAVDGLMGPATEGAIKQFQKANGLPPEGIITEPLLDAVKEIAIDILVVDRSGKERQRIKCTKGEFVFLGEVMVPCGATFVQDEGKIGGRIRY